MNWKKKLLIEKIMSFVPYGYQLLSHIAEKRGRFSFYDSDRINLGIKRCKTIYDKANFSFENKCIVELGTGRHGTDLLIFHLLGAKSIHTFDHISHLNFDKILTNIQNIERYFDKISTNFKIDKEILLERKSKIKVNDINSFLTSCGIITYSAIHPKKAKISPGSVDLFYSESVLQRIPTKTLINISKYMKDILSDSSVSYTSIDCNDINGMHRWDNSLWKFEYLKYSDFFWWLMTSKKFNNQNRLRGNEFIDILRLTGLHEVDVNVTVDEDDIEKFKNFKVAKRFEKFSLKDLATSQIQILSKRL